MDTGMHDRPDEHGARPPERVEHARDDVRRAARRARVLGARRDRRGHVAARAQTAGGALAVTSV